MAVGSQTEEAAPIAGSAELCGETLEAVGLERVSGRAAEEVARLEAALDGARDAAERELAAAVAAAEGAAAVRLESAVATAVEAAELRLQASVAAAALDEDVAGQSEVGAEAGVEARLVLSLQAAQRDKEEALAALAALQNTHAQASFGQAAALAAVKAAADARVLEIEARLAETEVARAEAVVAATTAWAAGAAETREDAADFDAQCAPPWHGGGGV